MSEESVPDPVVEPDPEPEGVIEVPGHGKVVPVGALSAERKRARETTEAKVRAEYEPLKAKAARADQLEADLTLLQPHIDHLRKHPELMQEQKAPDIPSVSDEEAEKEARDLELFTPTGLDLPRAKRIIAKRRAEVSAVAKEAAREAIAPYAASSATQQSRSNFGWAASQKNTDGSPLVDVNELARVWATFPPELTANPDVAKVVLKAAIGESVMTGKAPRRSEQEPVFSEVPGGNAPGGYRISQMERSVAKVAGLSEKAFSDLAKQYKPDAHNILGD